MPGAACVSERTPSSTAIIPMPTSSHDPTDTPPTHNCSPTPSRSLSINPGRLASGFTTSDHTHATLLLKAASRSKSSANDSGTQRPASRWRRINTSPGHAIASCSDLRRDPRSRNRTTGSYRLLPGRRHGRRAPDANRPWLRQLFPVMLVHGWYMNVLLTSPRWVVNFGDSGANHRRSSIHGSYRSICRVFRVSRSATPSAPRRGVHSLILAPSMRTNAILQSRLVRLDQEWLVARWMSTSPRFISRSPSSIIAQISPSRTMA